MTSIPNFLTLESSFPPGAFSCQHKELSSIHYQPDRTFEINKALYHTCNVLKWYYDQKIISFSSSDFESVFA